MFKKKSFDFQQILPLFKLILKYDKSLLFFMFVDAIFSALSPFPMIIFPKFIIDGFMNRKSYRHVLYLSVAMILISMFISIIEMILSRHLGFLKQRMEFTINAEIGKKCMEIDYFVWNNPETQDMADHAARVSNSNNLVSLLENVKGLFSNIIIFVGVIAIVITTNAILLWVSLLVLVVHSVISSRNRKSQRQYMEDAQPYLRRIDYMSYISWDTEQRKDIVAYSAADFFRAKIDAFCQSILTYFKSQQKRELKGSLLILVANNLFTFLAYTILGYQIVVLGTITVGSFSMYLNALNTFNSASKGIATSIIDIASQSKYLSKFVEFMDLKSTFRTGTKVLSEVVEAAPEISFENVSFKYPGQETYALKNININIVSTKSTAIVGENGAGKSTFVKLLMRLYDPTEGRILLNGVDIKEIDYDEYMGLFATVFQDFKLFAFTIRENLSLGTENSPDDINKMKKILQEVGFGDKLKTLKNGVETSLSRNFDPEGLELSGGERQKLAIARAKYKDAPILVLDEPTAALDPVAEHEMYTRFFDLVKDKTSIYISHRLASTQFCDEILVFDNGQIVEQGNCEQLLEMDGKYTELYNLQAQYYTANT
ncbi:MAG: ABC transporter ATP-binding protein [Lachnospiraceae bacterium]|nr:ABC transporter ATP-binding protein [Lachnospiraceae bacterium]